MQRVALPGQLLQMHQLTIEFPGIRGTAFWVRTQRSYGLTFLATDSFALERMQAIVESGALLRLIAEQDACQ